MDDFDHQLLLRIDELLRSQDYDQLQEVVLDALPRGLLDDAALQCARMLDLRPTVIYLATLGAENLPEPGKRPLWVEVYRTLGRRQATEGFDALPESLPLKWMVRALLSDGKHDLPALRRCHGTSSDWLDAFGFALDCRAPAQAETLTRHLAVSRVPAELWRQMASELLLRYEHIKSCPDQGALGRTIAQVIRQMPETAQLRYTRDLLAMHAASSLHAAGLHRQVIDVLARSKHPALLVSRLVATARAWCGLGDLPKSIQLLDRLLAQLGKPEHVELLRAERARRREAHGHLSATLDMGLATRALTDLQSALAPTGLQPFLVSGTLLGYARCGDFLPHDKDIDVGILGWEGQFDAIEALIASRLFAVGVRTLLGARTYHLPVRHLASGIHIDVFIYQEQDGHYVTGVQSAFGYLQTFAFSPFGLREVDFLGIRIHVPDDIERNLAENFGDWRTPDPGYISHLESPSTMDVGGLVYQLVGRLRCLDAFMADKRAMLLRAVDCLARVANRPGGMRADLIDYLRRLETPFESESMPEFLPAPGTELQHLEAMTDGE